MDDSTQGLLNELADAMARMPNDPQGVAGWLLSNYRFQKIGEAVPTEKFHRKGGNGVGASAHNIDESNLKVDPTYDQFLKRTDVYNKVTGVNPAIEKIKAQKSGKFAEAAAAIQMVDDPYEDDTHTVRHSGSNSDIEDFKAYKEMRAAGIDPFAESEGATSAGIITPQKLMATASMAESAFYADGGNGEEPLLPQEVEMMRTPMGRAELERQRFKKLKAQDALSGGGVGLFRR
jgi:hypothetical protein